VNRNRIAYSKIKNRNTMKNYAIILAAVLFTSIAHAQTNDDKEEITMDIKGVKYHMENVKGEMTTFSVDGKEIPATNWSDYRPIINQIKEQVEKDSIQAKKDRAQAVNDRAQAKLDRIQADKDRQQSVKDKAQAEKDREQARLDRIQADKDREHAQQDRIQADKDRERAKLDRIQADKDRVEAEKDKKEMASLVNDLIQDKIIADKASLQDLIFSKTEMIVNGQKQPETVYQKYKAKYTRFSERKMTFSSHRAVYTDSGR
jgi:colicin import membrane protein